MKLKVIILSLVLSIMVSSTCFAGTLHDIQDEIPTDKALHFAAGYIISDQLQRNAKCSVLESVLITSAIAWAKEKWVDDHVDNNDAYATMAGCLFYQIDF